MLGDRRFGCSAAFPRRVKTCWPKQRRQPPSQPERVVVKGALHGRRVVSLPADVMPGGNTAASTRPGSSALTGPCALVTENETVLRLPTPSPWFRKPETDRSGRR